jgi:hypothetical protein
MKTLHISIITGSGIIVLILIGFIFFLHPQQDQAMPKPITQSSSDISQTFNYSTEQNIAKTEQTKNIVNNFRENVQKQIWNYDVDGQIMSVATTLNGSYVVAGTRIQEMHADDNTHQGSVYLFDRAGNISWKYDSTRKIGSVSISNDGQHILATGYQIASGPAGIYENGAMYLFDKNGKVLWNYAPSDYGKTLVASMSSDGSYVAAASDTNLVYFDDSGNKLWNYTSDSSIYSISVSPDGSDLVASAGKSVYFFDKTGNLLWTFHTDYGYSTARISPDGRYVIASDAASGYDGKIYFIDNKGNLIKEDQVASPVLFLSISKDSLHTAIGTNWATMVFDSAGNLIWEDKIPSQVAMSSNGSFTAAVAGAGDVTYLTYFDNKGNILSRHPIGGWSQIVISGDSKYIALGYSFDGTNEVQFFEVPSDYVSGLAPSDIPQFNLQGMQASNYTHVSITPKNGTALYVEVGLGQTVQLPYDINFETNYTTSDLQLAINSSSFVDTTISPVFSTETINGIPPGEKMITIHASPRTTPGNYTLTITGTGRMGDDTTGWMTNLNNTVLAKIHVLVKPYSGQISLRAGSAHYEMRTFCVNLEPSGESCGSSPIYEKVPLTVYSNSTQTVKISALGLEEGEWVKFVPDKIVAGPGGAFAKMIIAGYEVPVIQNPLADKPLVIKISSQNETQTTIIHVIPLNPISILNFSSPIRLGSITVNSNEVNFVGSEAVYDPLDNSNSTLPVHLSVLGLLDGNNVSLLPYWFSVGIPNPSFTLNATQPYYFIITVKTSNAPTSGTYNVAIDENIGDRHYIQPLGVTIENVYH